jgi:soluble lytic murein transglycosylase-like protein
VSIEAIAAAQAPESGIQGANARVQELEALAAQATVARGPAETASFAALLAAAGEETAGASAQPLPAPSAQALAERTGGTAAPGAIAPAPGAGAPYEGPGAAGPAAYAADPATATATYAVGSPATPGAAPIAGASYPQSAPYADPYPAGPGSGGPVSQAAVERAGATPYAEAITHAALANGIEPAILFGLIEQESGFNPQARSSAGALGLTQLMPGTAASLGVREPLDPWEAIEGGARYLGNLLREFHGNVQDALAAYNAGPGAVSAAGGIPPIPETEAYVSSVIANARSFRGE